jgi:hypothetical protein
MKKSTVEFWLIIAIIVSFGTAAGFISGCEKTRADPGPRALSAACIDTAGTYIPVVLSSFNAAGIVNVRAAHFIRVCNEVFVSGSFGSVNRIADTVLFSLIELSLPVPSNLAASPAGVSGQAIIGQSLIAPYVGTSILAHATDAGVSIKWQSKKLVPVGVTYNFSYSIN